MEPTILNEKEAENFLNLVARDKNKPIIIHGTVSPVSKTVITADNAKNYSVIKGECDMESTNENQIADARICNSYEYDLMKALAFADRKDRHDLSMLYHFVDPDMISKRYQSVSKTLKELNIVDYVLSEYGVIKQDTVDIPRLVSIVKGLLEMHHALKYDIFDKMLEQKKSTKLNEQQEN